MAGNSKQIRPLILIDYENFKRLQEKSKKLNDLSHHHKTLLDKHETMKHEHEKSRKNLSSTQSQEEDVRDEDENADSNKTKLALDTSTTAGADETDTATANHDSNEPGIEVIGGSDKTLTRKKEENKVAEMINNSENELRSDIIAGNKIKLWWKVLN